MPTAMKYNVQAKKPALEVLHQRPQFQRSSSMQSLTSKTSRSSKSGKYSCKEAVESVQLSVAIEPAKHTKRVTFGKQQRIATPIREVQVQTGLTSCLITNASAEERQLGGANNPAERKVGFVARTDSECKIKAPGIDFLKGAEPNVKSFELKLNTTAPAMLKNKCDFFPKYVSSRPFKDQATQTLYRESSAQTLPYLPEIMDKELDEGLELFSLPLLLPSDKPPGVYEVEILERARKRWAFNKALKTNFKRQLYEARQLAIKTKYKSILEAFEWERWVEREEHIQECQMARLEIVIGMFDKREREMHTEFKTRIEVACERIEQTRQRKLAKNEIVYQRDMRRLQQKRSGTSRRWSKANPVTALGSPCSELYAPLLRHGVDPARQHFKSGRKAFDMRIDNLEKRVNMNQLQCPFTKLKEWSKPKEIVKEYEQNFCSDNNLQKLYESLKGLRTQATKLKVTPKCLKKRQHPEPPREKVRHTFYDYRETLEGPGLGTPEEYDAQNTAKKSPSWEDGQTAEQNRRMLEHQHAANVIKERMLERQQEDLENLLHMYEGTTIGWIMQFLAEEMERLKEQRKLHFFAILAQKERWRREAAEAGLRQKENDMRNLYEEMFQESNLVNNEVTDEYINAILATDMSHVAERQATETVTDLAKKIDMDIERWLDNIKLVQTPLTYEPLRVALRDFVFPDLNKKWEEYEKELVAKYIVDDVLFTKIWDFLEPFHIGSTLASDLIDRFIDNDLYLFSTESESETRPAALEVEAIMRKVIRHAVPGRRWKTEVERIVHTNYEDLLDDVFAGVIRNMCADLPAAEPILVREIKERDMMLKNENLHEAEKESKLPSLALNASELIRAQMLSLIKKLKIDKITKALDSMDVYKGDDNFNDGDHDTLLEYGVYNRAIRRSMELKEVHSVISVLDIGEEPDFNVVRIYRALEKLRQEADKSSSLSDIGILFNYHPTEIKEESTSHDQLLDIVKTTVYHERGLDEHENYEADDEQSSSGWLNSPEPMHDNDDIELVQDSESSFNMENACSNIIVEDQVSLLQSIDELPKAQNQSYFSARLGTSPSAHSKYNSDYQLSNLGSQDDIGSHN